MTKNFTKSHLKEKKEFFNKNGFVVFENVLSKNDLNKVRKKYKKRPPKAKASWPSLGNPTTTKYNIYLLVLYL